MHKSGKSISDTSITRRWAKGAPLLDACAGRLVPPRTWPSGSMVLWVALLLGMYLVFHYT